MDLELNRQCKNDGAVPVAPSAERPDPERQRRARGGEREKKTEMGKAKRGRTNPRREPGTTICYVNKQHEDEDLGLTMLACTGEPAGGGEFVHAAHGRAHRVHAGDVLVINPKKRHGTAEFELASGDSLRAMTAFFLKTDVVSALGLSAADAAVRGLAVPGAQRKRTRRARGAKRKRGAEGAVEGRGAEGRARDVAGVG